MGARCCPRCMAVVPAGHAVAYSNAIECPGCKAQLEVSDGSRHLATLAGLLAGVLVWRMTRGAGGTLGWVLPMVCSILAYGVVAPLTLAAIADLRLKPETPPQPVPLDRGHPAGHP